MSGRVNFGMVDQAMNTMDKMKQYVTAGMDTALDVVTDFENYPQGDTCFVSNIPSI